MRKAVKLISPALLLGAAMALPLTSASAAIYDYSGSGTYTDFQGGLSETFSASFVFDTASDMVTSAAISSPLGEFDTILSTETGDTGGVFRLSVGTITSPIFSLLLIDPAAMLLGQPVTLNEDSDIIQLFTTQGPLLGENLTGTFTAAVPEPSTWAMMLLGFAGLGFMAYRKKSKSASMAA
jgi:hypothetical protein